VCRTYKRGARPWYVAPTWYNEYTLHGRSRVDLHRISQENLESIASSIRPPRTLSTQKQSPIRLVTL